MKRVIFITVVFALSGIVYAGSLPMFRIVRVKQLDYNSVSIVAEFDSRNQVSFQGHKLPTTWFEYGVDPSKLTRKTVETPRVGGHYFVEQRVFDLQPGVKYYVRPVLKLGGNISYGKLSTFRTTVKEEKGSSPALGGYDDSRIEFTDEGYVKKNQKGTEVYTFTDFWRELTHIFGFTKRKDGKTEEQEPYKGEGKEVGTVTGDITERSNLPPHTSYDTQYRKYYRSSARSLYTRSGGLSRPAPLLPIFLLLIILFVIVILFHLLRRWKWRRFLHSGTPSQRYVRSTPRLRVRRVPTERRTRTPNKRYHIDHDPIDKVRGAME